MYKVYTISQNGKKRQIEEPDPELKKKQREMIPFFAQFPFHSCCHSVAERSILTNASVHKDAKHILRIDIKGCYQHTTRDKVITGWYQWSDLPNLLPEFVDKLSDCLIYNSKQKNWILPTGSPTSPILCNIALTPIDYLAYVKACDFGYRYSRYMDDLHFSTSNPKRAWELKDAIEDIVERNDYIVNHKKSKWLTVSSDKTVITGVQIGQGNKVPSQFYRMMRARLNNLAKDGLDIDQETRGCLAYIKSIDAEKYQYLTNYYQKRYDRYFK